MNLVSRSKVMDFGTLCKCKTSLKNRLAIRVAFEVFLHDMKWDIFEYLSTTTKTESIHCSVQGRLDIKSIDISFHGACGTGKGMYKLEF